MTKRIPLFVLLGLQVICTIVFVSDIMVSVLGLRSVPIDWQLREFIEIGAACGLILGLFLGIFAVLKSEARRQHVEDQLQAASGALSDLILQRFAEWELTAAERDVALYAVKGFTLAEMAALRGTSEGTVKAQTAAIYRKAGVSGRTQLVSLFVEDLMENVLLPTEAGRGTRRKGAA
ncbi:MAG: helix-turn-helix transcriptional regulator [Pseudomonadota bacterium]